MRRRPAVLALVGLLLAAVLVWTTSSGTFFASPRPAVAVSLQTSAASSFCDRIPAAKVGAVVGGAMALRDAVAVKTVLECVYQGVAVVSISKEPDMKAADLATRGRAEATAAGVLPRGTKISFRPVASLGPTAFSWTAQLDGATFSGLADNRATTGYGVQMAGPGRLTQLERLLALDLAA